MRWLEKMLGSQISMYTRLISIKYFFILTSRQVYDLLYNGLYIYARHVFYNIEYIVMKMTEEDF